MAKSQAKMVVVSHRRCHTMHLVLPVVPDASYGIGSCLFAIRVTSRVIARASSIGAKRGSSVDAGDGLESVRVC